ncbi:unnamed protein product [Cladocopium goreaui]|uniref:Endo-1,4-beta-xylanase A (Xylanase A) (1,4-beta-D-xylan xylanohydrolase A) n=1 Tax=Cladocopium goreaui TaxID=2562237 RepID=A0A9P1GNC4_9DINO|nr:unnamed protein product [Cladocopium goreaui]
MRSSSGDTCEDSEDHSLLPRLGVQSQLRTNRSCLVCLGVSLVAAVSLIFLRSLSEEHLRSLVPVAQRVRVVEELYTFGTPGSAKDLLSDRTREDGCFRGLRVYMRSARPGWGDVDVPVYDPVAWITQQFSYRHARMRFLELPELNLYQHSISPCSAPIEDPPSDTFWWIEGHSSYEAALKHHLQATDQELPQDLKATTSQLNDLQKAYLMSHFTFVIYDPQMATVHADAIQWGWTLVGYAESLPGEPRVSNSIVTFHDHAALFQHPRSLECVLAFEGSDREDVSDWVYDVEIATVDFCGFTNVHRGFKEKLMAMLESDDFDQAIRVRLPYCSKLIAAGHSMGGSQAELFSACANRHLKENEEAALRDQQLVKFETKKPTALKPYLSEQVPGIFLRNRLSNLCLDAVGLLDPAEVKSLQAGLCHDQRQVRQHWKVEDGRVISELAGLCLTVQESEHEDATVIQTPCQSEADGRVARNQSWQLTAQGFLLSRSTDADRCLNTNMKLYRCPYSDQVWDLSADGHLVNRLSGLCLDVAGAASVQGTSLQVQNCRAGHDSFTSQRWQVADGQVRSLGSDLCLAVRTSQQGLLQLIMAACSQEVQWELLPLGFLQHRPTGMCVNVDGSPGQDAGTSVDLAPCELKEIETPGLWKLTPEGFLLNKGSDWLQVNKCISSAEPGSQDASSVSLELCEFQSAQSWDLRSTLRSTLGSQKCVALSEDNGLKLQTCDKSLKQQWRFSGQWIRNQQTGDCLTAKEADLSLSPCDASVAQQWEQLDLRKTTEL